MNDKSTRGGKDEVRRKMQVINHKSHQIAHFVNCIRLILERALKIIYSKSIILQKRGCHHWGYISGGQENHYKHFGKLVPVKSSHSLVKLV